MTYTKCTNHKTAIHQYHIKYKKTSEHNSVWNISGKNQLRPMSTYEQKISTKEMLSIEFQDDSASKNGYTFRVETKDKCIFYNCRTATECKKWVEVLNKSKKTIEEMGRTK